MNNSMSHRTSYIYLLISFVITLYNILTIGSTLGIILPLIEFAYVLYNILKGNYSCALYWHLVFVMTSISSASIEGMNSGNENISVYNYYSVKLVGPIGISYLFTILLFLISLTKKIGIRNRLMHQLLFVLLYFAISGDIIGIIGFCFNTGYYLPDFIKYNIYIWISIFTLYSILHLFDSNYISRCFHSAIPIISGSIIACLISRFMGIYTTYGGLEIPYVSDLCYFGSVLIIALFFKASNKLIIIPAIICYGILMTQAMSGKMVFYIIIAFMYIAYLSFFNKDFQESFKYVKTLRLCCIIIVMIGAVYIPIIMSDTSSLTSIKITAAASIFSGSLEDVSNSPATRIAEVANFFYNNRTNPFNLLFGNGYGGYFTDELGIMSGLDLSGGWSDEVIRSGRFSSAHDTFSVVPLLNGVIGLVLAFYIGLKIFYRTKQNYLSFVAIPWIIFTLYFNTLYATIAIFCLIGSLYENKRVF